VTRTDTGRSRGAYGRTTASKLARKRARRCLLTGRAPKGYKCIRFKGRLAHVFRPGSPVPARVLATKA
jgi:hypothetical protein